MTVIRVHWGKMPLFFNFGCAAYIQEFLEFLNSHGWKNFQVLTNSCPIYTIDETAETIKTEMLARFWDWMHSQMRTD